MPPRKGNIILSAKEELVYKYKKEIEYIYDKLKKLLPNTFTLETDLNRLYINRKDMGGYYDDEGCIEFDTHCVSYNNKKLYIKNIQYIDELIDIIIETKK